MSDTSDRLGLQFLLPGQGQKELTVNEALLTIDSLLHAAVQGPPRSDPPDSPIPGETWLVGSDALADWAGRTGQIARYTFGGWRFFQPVLGMTLWDVASARPIHFDGEGWQAGPKPVSSAPVISDPAGGTNVDVQARAAILALLQRLRAIGVVAELGG
jgi:hypothetical protein